MKRICRVLEIDRSSYYDHLALAGARQAWVSAEDKLGPTRADAPSFPWPGNLILIPLPRQESTDPSMSTRAHDHRVKVSQ